jgi:hypothetical protein
MTRLKIEVALFTLALIASIVLTHLQDLLQN